MKHELKGNKILIPKQSSLQSYSDNIMNASPLSKAIK